MAPSDSCPNISVRKAVCSSFGLAATASSTLKMVPCASFCMSLASCVAEKPRLWKASACALVIAEPFTSVVVKLFRAVEAISGEAPAERKAAPSAATCVSASPDTIATAPTRWTTSPSAGAVAFMLFDR